jgi:hypothetical protein
MFTPFVAFAAALVLWSDARRVVEWISTAHPVGATQAPESCHTNRRQSRAAAASLPAGQPERRPAATTASIPPIWCGGRTLYANGKMAGNIGEAPPFVSSHRVYARGVGCAGRHVDQREVPSRQGLGTRHFYASRKCGSLRQLA